LIVRVVVKFAGWVVAFFVVSSERMLLVTGTLIRAVNTISISSVTHLAVQRSFGGRLLGYGSLIIEYGGQDQKVERIEYLPPPGRALQNNI
jgi:uncharacterized membrane protein YdbT with pleckstrin-like domain